MGINVLDKFTAELIAAGEVVERPASIVKELCENAIDAGAKNICVEIQNGGTKLIRIQDDGCGIDTQEIPTAFLRHATSKLKNSDDLNSIETLGFRGEALPSISSVARVSLLSKTHENEFASLYRIEGGEEISFETAAGANGTSIVVEDIFYNTPARMKFLKKDSSEANYVSDVVLHAALSHPEISFTFIKDNKTAFITPGDSKLESAVYSCLGSEFSKQLASVNSNNGAYSVNGLITYPRFPRASRSMQFFYINGRYVKNRTVMAALEQAYKGRIMTGRFPGAVLFLTMPPELVDVNVHPAKTEVRFARESDVFDTVYRGVKNTLQQNDNNYGTIDLSGSKFFKQNNSENVENNVNEAEQTEFPTNSAVTSTNNIVLPNEKDMQHQISEQADVFIAAKTSANHLNGALSEATTDILMSDSEYSPYITKERNLSELDIYAAEDSGFADENNSELISNKLTENIFDSENQEIKIIGEAFKTYIITQFNDKLCLIDKHAAHERIIYEKLLMQRGKPDVQQLLVPETVTLSGKEKSALLQNAALLQDAGIDIEDFGERTVIVRGLPADVKNLDITNLIIEIAAKMDGAVKDAMDDKTEWILHSVACRSAVKAGDKSVHAEMISLAKDILLGKTPPYCPHGRPVLIEISRKELEKQFGRLG